VQFATHHNDASSDVINVPWDKAVSRYIQEAIPVKFGRHPTTRNNEDPRVLTGIHEGITQLNAVGELQGTFASSRPHSGVHAIRNTAQRGQTLLTHIPLHTSAVTQIQHGCPGQSGD